MKNPKIQLLTVCLILFFLTGCKFTEIFNRSGKPAEPKALKARMIDTIPVPAEAEVVSDNKSEADSVFEERTISLKVPASVYDVAHFYRTEMEKNGWTGEKRNERDRDDAGSILSFLKFSNENEEIDVQISSATEESSEVNLRISASDQKRDRDRDRESADRDREREKERTDRDRKREAETDELRNGFPLHSCAEDGNVIRVNNTLTITAECSEELSALAEFYKKEAPLADWKLSTQTQSPDGAVFIFSKAGQKAVVTLAKKDPATTSVSVGITK